MARKAIGIDLGGTDIKAGVVDEDGKVLSRVKVPTEADRDHGTVVGNIAAAAQKARREAGLQWRGIAAIGLGSPGIFVQATGVLHHTHNIPCLMGKPLIGPVAEALGAKKLLVYDNDANMAAFAEAWMGVGRGRKTLALMTLGTGIGGGIVLDGKVWRGAWGGAGELGHQIIHPTEADHGCGTAGALEDFASGRAMVRRFCEAVGAGRRSSLARRVRSGGGVSAKEIADAARAGDGLSLRIVRETGDFLGLAAANMCHVLNVEVVVFAGGLTAAGGILLRAVRESFRRRCIPFLGRKVKVLFSRLGNDAGLLGAAGLALTEARVGRGRKGGSRTR